MDISTHKHIIYFLNILHQYLGFSVIAILKKQAKKRGGVEKVDGFLAE